MQARLPLLVANQPAIGSITYCTPLQLCGLQHPGTFGLKLHYSTSTHWSVCIHLKDVLLLPSSTARRKARPCCQGRTRHCGYSHVCCCLTNRGAVSEGLPEGVFLLLDSVDECAMEDRAAGACQWGAAVGGAVLPRVHQPMSVCTPGTQNSSHKSHTGWVHSCSRVTCLFSSVISSLYLSTITYLYQAHKQFTHQPQVVQTGCIAAVGQWIYPDSFQMLLNDVLKPLPMQS